MSDLLSIPELQMQFDTERGTVHAVEGLELAALCADDADASAPARSLDVRYDGGIASK